MSLKLERFRIEGLHGVRTADISFDDNRLILVGENGTGKSTVANIIYFFLTRQWFRLFSYRFDSVSMTLNGQNFQISSHKLLKGIEALSSETSVPLLRQFRRQAYAFSRAKGKYAPASLFLGTEDVSELISNLKIALDMDEDEVLHFLMQSVIEEERLPEIHEIVTGIDKIVEEQVLYLPTYRRIERELEYIFPQIDLTEADQYRKQRRSRRGSHREPYLELVEFGMQDVDRTLNSTMEYLKEVLRQSLNRLTGDYLREVIQEQYEETDLSALAGLEKETLDEVLDRVGENLLSINDKSTLRRLIRDIDTKEQLNDRQKIIAHFFLKLLDLHRQQEKNESSVQSFIEVCNKYLSGKAIQYDSSQYEISILQTEAVKDEELELQMLSSGEKQIVSLFSHIYLSGEDKYFVLIDEPELSLSVTWQRQFLPDILNTGKCSGLIAVTHSPFIFDNELDKYAHGIEEFWVTD